MLPPPERRTAIEAVFEILGDNPLRPVWDELGGEYSYDEIRLVRLARRFPAPTEQAAPPNAAAPDPRSMMGIEHIE